MDQHTSAQRDAYNRIAQLYDRTEMLQRPFLGATRADLLGRARGRTLEVAFGSGHNLRHYPADVEVVGLDLSPAMLALGRARADRWGRQVDLVEGDAQHLDLPDRSFDTVSCLLALCSIGDQQAALAEMHRVLRPGGLLLVSTFGHDTLHELRHAFAQADDEPHVSPFVTIAQFGDALMQAGFRNPVVERDLLQQPHTDLASLMRSLRNMGATNALQQRRRTLTGRGRFARAAEAYDTLRPAPDAPLPSSWEIITAMAWAPDHGAPIREGGEEIARFPAHGIPVRRR